jgi:hypothetical protein
LLTAKVFSRFINSFKSFLGFVGDVEVFFWGVEVLLGWSVRNWKSFEV